MVFLVLVGLVNLLLGFVAAVALAGQLSTLLAQAPWVATPRPRLRPEVEPDPPPPEAAVESATDEFRFTIATPRQTDEIPTPWLEMLDESIHTNTFVEAAIHVLRLEVGHYRDQLIALEMAARHATSGGEAQTLETCIRDLSETNRQWIAKQAEATQHLRARRDRLGDLTVVGRRLEAVLLQQQAQIETTCGHLENLDFLSAPEMGLGRLLREIAKLVDLAHALRDHILESLVSIASKEARLLQLDSALLFDTAFDAPNRAGLEAMFEEWRRDDPRGERMLSVAMVDIDRFAEFNERLGTLAGDRVLAAMSKMLAACLRKNRGFDRLGRFAGQQFLVFLGDTGPYEATAVAERLRQTVTATSFVVSDEEVALTLRSSSTGVKADDTMETLSRRLLDGLRVAGQGGGNRSVLDEGLGPTLVLPPTYDVRGQIVRVDEPQENAGDQSALVVAAGA